MISVYSTAIGLRRIGRFITCGLEASLRHIKRDTAAVDITYTHRGSPKQSRYLQS